MPASHAWGQWFDSHCWHALFLLLLPDQIAQRTRTCPIPDTRYPITRCPLTRCPLTRYPLTRYPLTRYPLTHYPLTRYVITKYELHPVRSDKIRARILDLGSGAARRALQNLCPKSARILSAAITRTILLPAGVRQLVTNIFLG